MEMNVSKTRHFSSPSAAVGKGSCLWLLQGIPWPRRQRCPEAEGSAGHCGWLRGDKAELWDTWFNPGAEEPSPLRGAAGVLSSSPWGYFDKGQFWMECPVQLPQAAWEWRLFHP